MNGLNYKHLYYFWIISNEGSIKAAASRLHVSPQAISKQLTQFEKRIGQPLFHRKGSAMQLSDTGKWMKPYADEIYSVGKMLSERLRDVAFEQPTEFVIGAISALPKAIVAKTIDSVVDVYHNATFLCKEGVINDLIKQLAVHEINMILTDDPRNSNDNVNVEVSFLGSSPVSAFASPKLKSHLSGKFPQCLKKAPLLLPTAQCSFRHLFDKWQSSERFIPNIKGQFDDSALLKVSGESGLGVFFMPTIIEQEIIDNYDVELLGRLQNVRQRFYALTSKDDSTHPAAVHVKYMAKNTIFYCE